jgi:hypothetical protein
MSAALSLSTTEGRSIVCFFGHPSIRLLSNYDSSQSDICVLNFYLF